MSTTLTSEQRTDQADTARMCTEFTTVLRSKGVTVGPSQALTFYEAVHAVGDLSAADLFWAGRATLATDPADYFAYALAFAEYFAGDLGDDRPEAAPPTPKLLTADGDPSGPPPMELADDKQLMELPQDARVIASEAERLRTKSFAKMTTEERREAARIIRQLPGRLRPRLSRRRRAARTGRFLDMRRTLRHLLSSDGEPMRLDRRRRRVQRRTLTFLIDVSGSMAAYGNAVLILAHALQRAGERVEVFTVGVRLHRVTDALRSPSPDRALERVGQAVTDWEAGTRLATSFTALLDSSLGHNALRGAMVVVASDGLDHDDPAEMAAAMSRVQRLSHRLLWLNPLKGDPRYQPLARGMAAALPYIDDFRPGHSIASLAGVISGLAGRDGRGRRAAP